MKVVILCGGLGTRIRDVAEHMPKPMIPVGGYPILWHIMKIYASAGHRDFVLCLGHLGHTIRHFFLNYQEFTRDITLTLGKNRSVEVHNPFDAEGWRVTLVDTGANAMTGARVHRIRKYVEGDESFFLTYGDGVSDIDVEALSAFHGKHRGVMTVTGVRPPGRFGEIECDAEGQVSEFNEKPQASSGVISGGFFVCRRAIFDYLSDREDLVLEQQPMQTLARDGKMMIYRHNGFWQCMDTPRDHRLLEGLWNGGHAPWKNW